MAWKTFWYWVAVDPREPAYSVRGRTRRECSERAAEVGSPDLERPRRVSVSYRDLIDLIDKCLGEDAGRWENG